ncbi:MAG: hypothetical protein HYV33_00775 [Candidatus Kerfeldbacteria bacterium]|nr:hypothetical protein [Candidatus Kerfeldbacteria bacterium]
MNKATTNTNVAVVNINEVFEDVETTNEVDTSDWLTYTNEEYGFRFKYPREWSIQERKNYINIFSAKQSELLKNDPQTSAQIYISVLNDPNPEPIQELYKNEKDFKLIQSDSAVMIISYEDFNEYANSSSIYYYFQNKQNNIIRATYFKDNLEADLIKKIINTVQFNS